MSQDRILERTNNGYVFRYYESVAGTRYSHFDCERRLDTAKNAMERWFSRALRTRTQQDDEMDRYELQRLRSVADDLAQYATVIQHLTGSNASIARTSVSRRCAQSRDARPRRPPST
jgi:hypothetical protein